MQLTRIELSNFRSYTNYRLDLAPLTVLLGDNGVGKTNVIEAITLLATGLSQRAQKIEEMVRFGQEVASVSGIVEDVGGTYTSLSVVLTKGVVIGHKTPKRRYLIDGVARTRARLVGKLPVVSFRPEDMRLIEGSPSRRRQYLDETISSANPEYVRSLAVYDSSLRQRNRLLDTIREGGGSRAQLTYWDQSILKHGEIITKCRRNLIDYLNEQVKVNFGDFVVHYDASIISPARLKQYEVEEVLAGHTLVGPHKDDISISEQKKDLMTYGSRGEQRLGVLFFKLGALSYIEKTTGSKPLILLDDIFSELDLGHRGEILLIIKDHQCVITTAEPDVVDLLSTQAKVVRL